MSCTVFYRGKLKPKYEISELFQVIKEDMQDTSWTYEIEKECMAIDLMDGESETLVFDFHDRKVDGFCKIFSDDIKVFFRIFDLFYKIKPMFYRMTIEDDDGLWADYLARKTPPKITLKELTKEQAAFITAYRKEVTSSNILYGMILTDLRKDESEPFTYQTLLKHVNPKVPSHIDDSHFMANEEILETWVYETMEYKDYGKVCELDPKTRGLNTSLLSFSFGIAETILGSGGGLIGSKQADIRRLYELEVYNKKIDIQKDHVMMFRFLLSVMAYLGFHRERKK